MNTMSVELYLNTKRGGREEHTNMYTMTCKRVYMYVCSYTRWYAHTYRILLNIIMSSHTRTRVVSILGYRLGWAGWANMHTHTHVACYATTIVIIVHRL